MKILRNALSRRLSSLGISPWMLAGAALILGLTLAGFSVRSNQRERAFMVHNLTDRAETLIWALEAGTRTGMRFSPDAVLGLRPLLTETARQPGILYMAVTDAEGGILAQSGEGAGSSAETAGSGQVFAALAPLQAADIPPLAQATDKPQWRVRERGGRQVFEVFRTFAPLNRGRRQRDGGHGQHGRGFMGGMMHMMGFGGPAWPDDAPSRGGVADGRAGPGDAPRQVVGVALVGFDAQPFEDALAQDARTNLLSAALAAALGLAGFVMLFWAHNNRRWRRILRDQQVMAAEVVASLPLGLLISDPAGRIAMINDAALDMFGRKRGDILPPGDGGRAAPPHPGGGAALESLKGLAWEDLTRALNGGARLPEREITLAVPGGKPLAISLSAAGMRNEDGVFLGNVFVLRDITEMKRLQADAQRNDRLAALGHLAAGVAHEIRNPLSTIKGVALYIAKRMPQGGREEEAAQRMIDEVTRLDRVVSELLEFARPGNFATAPADLGEVIDRALRLAEADVQARNIAVIREVEPGFPPVRVSSERLTQALLNLFLNAVQAMEPGGTLRVSARLLPDNMFGISVADTGPGISPEVQAAIFTPYFTTKSSGTGLGLAIVYQIVEGHGGSISVGNAAGHGAEFTLTLPVDGKTPPLGAQKTSGI